MIRLTLALYLLSLALGSSTLVSQALAGDRPDFAPLLQGIERCMAVPDNMQDAETLTECEASTTNMLSIGNQIGWSLLWKNIPEDPAWTMTHEQARATIYLVRGTTRFLRKDYEGSVEDLSLAIELNPDELAFRIERNRSLFQLGQFDNAIKDIEFVRARDPDFLCSYKECGLAYFMVDDYKNALTGLNQYLDRVPDHSNVLWVRGFIFYELERYDDAALDIKNYLILEPTDFRTYFLLAEIHFLQLRQHIKGS